MLNPTARKVHAAVLVACGAECAKGTREVFRPEESGEVDTLLNQVGGWIESSDRAGYPGSRRGLANVIAHRVGEILNDRSEATLENLEQALLMFCWD